MPLPGPFVGAYPPLEARGPGTAPMWHLSASRYVEGDVSPADGVGFIFGDSLPSTQNIQKVESVFVNKHGVVCSRTRWGVVREPIKLAPLDIGARIGVTVDLDAKRAFFRLDHNGKFSCV